MQGEENRIAGRRIRPESLQRRQIFSVPESRTGQQWDKPEDDSDGVWIAGQSQSETS
jgi:hypothetical protein